MLDVDTNPIFDWTGPGGLPDFAAIDRKAFAAAFDKALEADAERIDAVAENPEPATFCNTIEALEWPAEGASLNRVAALFYNLVGADSDETLRDLEREIAPRLSRHRSKIAANEKLFARIAALWERRDESGQTGEQLRVLERHHTGFVDAGAALAKAGQERLAEINARLASLGAQFSQNILADEAAWSMQLTDEGDLEGLPDDLRSAMASAAEEWGLDRGWAVTLSRSIIEPFLTFSARRELREQAFSAWVSRGEKDGENDNRPLVAEIVALRREKANLLGFENFAAFKLKDQMAKTPDAVSGLLENVWEKARQRASEEAEKLAQIATESGANHAIMPWDWRYLAEKQRARSFDYDDGELKPYLSLDAMIAACFDVANRLFGITIEERPEVAAYHGDVRVFEVLDADGSHRAWFLGDYFNRASKRSGAWMSGFQSQHRLGSGQQPIIVNVMNFAKAPAGKPTLLSLDDAHTLFHEFGHALHGMLSDVTYPSVSGTAVARDFVELPSQLFEHWLMTPQVLNDHARHVETGEAMPQALIDKVRSAQTFNAGFDAVEFTASALVDMAFHTHDGEIGDVMAFQAQVLDDLQMPRSIVMRHATPHFAHVFSGDGYSAGYYSYMWSEVLDADAFAAFREAGDVFDAETARRLRSAIYGSGGSLDPEEAYKAFRGRMPDATAMLEKRGLVAA